MSWVLAVTNSVLFVLISRLLYFEAYPVGFYYIAVIVPAS